MAKYIIGTSVAVHHLSLISKASRIRFPVQTSQCDFIVLSYLSDPS